MAKRAITAFVLPLAVMVSLADVSAQELRLAGRQPDGPTLTSVVQSDTIFFGSGALFGIAELQGSKVNTLGSATTPSIVDGIAVSGTTAYVATWHAGLRVYDTSDTSLPSELGSLSTPGTSRGVAVTHPYVYLADGASGLRVVDVSSSDSPIEVGSYVPGSTAYDVDVAGGLAYLAAGDGGLRIIDVNTPSSPILVGTFNLGGGQLAFDVVVSDTLAYLAYSAAGLVIVNISNPGSPTQLASVASPEESVGITYLNDIVIVADEAPGIRLFDVSQPSTPVQLSSLDTPGDAFDVAVDGATLVIADSHAGVRVVDIVQPTTPTEVAFHDVPGRALTIATGNEHVYLSDGPDGVRAIDASLPYAPEQIASVATTGQVADLTLADTLLFAAELSPNYGVTAISVDDPAVPAIAGHFSTGEPGYGIDSDWPYVYITLTTEMKVIDATNPSAMTEAGTFVAGSAFTALLRSLFVRTGTAYLCDYLSGLRVVDVSNPASPSQLDVLSLPNLPYDVIADNMYAYVSAPDGVYVVDVSVPTAAVQVGFVATAQEAWAITQDQDYLYVAMLKGGVGLIDASTPTAPVFLGSIETGDKSVDIDLLGSFIVAADDHDGAYVIYNTDVPTGVAPPSIQRGSRIERVYPNPFNPSVSIAYSITNHARVQLQVFDVRGRLVRTLHQRLMRPGTYSAVWDGAMADGSPSPAGIYFVRLAAGPALHSRKVVLIR